MFYFLLIQIKRTRENTIPKIKTKKNLCSILTSSKNLIWLSWQWKPDQNRDSYKMLEALKGHQKMSFDVEKQTIFQQKSVFIFFNIRLHIVILYSKKYLLIRRHRLNMQLPMISKGEKSLKQDSTLDPTVCCACILRTSHQVWIAMTSR